MMITPLVLDWFYLPGFTFLVLAYPGIPTQSTGGHKMVAVIVVGCPGKVVVKLGVLVVVSVH